MRKLVGLKERHPSALVLAHPECEEPLLAMADFIGSTTALLKYAVASPASEFIVATEPGILHQMRRQAPEKTFIPAPPEANCACNECPFMKKHAREGLPVAARPRAADRDGAGAHRTRARPIDRMLALS